MNIAIVNYPDAILSSVIGPYEILSRSNALLQMYGVKHNPVQLKVEVVTDKNTTIPPGSANFQPHLPASSCIQDKKKYDLIIIPAMDFEKVAAVLDSNRAMIGWIRDQYYQGAEIASLCMGAFMLAATGLLNGKSATTHWMGADMFRTLFPEVNLLDEKIIVDNDRLYSSGGAFSFTSLIIYLVEKYFGRKAAVLISKIFLIHIIDTRQTTFAILNLQKQHADEKIKLAQQYIEENYQDQLTIAYLAAHVNLGARTFIRKFKTATGNTPYEYIQRVRIEAAKRVLEESDKGVEQTSISVGYDDFSTFRKVFRKFAGTTPIEYKKQYAKVLVNEPV